MNYRAPTSLEEKCPNCRQRRCAPDRRLSHFDPYRAMVGALHVGADEGAFQARSQAGADEKIVNAPANVPFPHARDRTPPGVMPTALLELTERVEETRLHQRVEAGAFLLREAMVVDVGFGMGEVHLRVRYVEIPAKDHWLAPLELLEVTEEGAVPLPAVREPGEFALRVGHIDVYEKKVGILGGEHSPL